MVFIYPRTEARRYPISEIIMERPGLKRESRTSCNPTFVCWMLSVRQISKDINIYCIHMIISYATSRKGPPGEGVYNRIVRPYVRNSVPLKNKVQSLYLKLGWWYSFKFIYEFLDLHWHPKPVGLGKSKCGTSETFAIFWLCCRRLVGWLVVMRIYVASAVFQPYRDLEAGDNQSLKIQVARPGIEPRSSCSATCCRRGIRISRLIERVCVLL